MARLYTIPIIAAHSASRPSEARRDQILAAVRAIPAGFVRTYGDVSPGAPRLAGKVLSEHHSTEVPWWRVVRADGSLAAGAPQRSRLEAEGVPLRPGATVRVDLRVARLPTG